MRFHVGDTVRHTFLDQQALVMGTWVSQDGLDMLTVLLDDCKWSWLARDCDMVSQDSDHDNDNFWF